MKQYLGVDKETNIAVSGVWVSDSIIPDSQFLVEFTGDAAQGWSWNGTAWQAPEDTRTYAEKRKAEYPSMEEQADMQYWDAINGTTVWQDTITAIKAKYPKEI